MTDANDLSNLTAEQKRAMLAELLRRKAEKTSSEAPLSFGQRALWFVYQLDPASSAYNVSVGVRIHRAIDVAALKRAFATLIARHASLRSFFKTEAGEPRRHVRGLVEMPFLLEDATGLSEEQLFAHVGAHHRRPFDLENGPVCRVSLFTVSDVDHVMLFTAHHIAIDGWSAGIVIDELQRTYAAEAAGGSLTLPPVPFEYASFVEWQSRFIEAAGAEMEAFWRKALAAPLPVLDLPTDRPRPPVQSFNGGAVLFRLPPPLFVSLNQLARAEGVTLFTLLVSAYFVLLNRYSGQDDIVVGTPALGRSRPEFEGIVGYFVNPVALRASMAGQPTFREFVLRVKDVVQGALNHQELPFALLVERLQPKRDSSRSPIFQAMFNLLRSQWVWGRGAEEDGAAGLPMEPYAIPQEEGQFDVALDMVDANGEFGVMLRYNSDLFERQTMEAMGEHWRTLLESVVANPEARLADLSLLSEADRHRTLVEWNATASDYDPAESVEAIVAAQVRRAPDAIAVVCSGRALTYAELDVLSNQFARHLRDRGVQRGTMVGICLKRGVELPIALLGVLKAGGVYVPLDPAFPAQRLALMVEDAALTLVVTDADSEDALPESNAQRLRLDEEWPRITAGDRTAPARLSSAEDLAYVLYTSGSTGKPKGVQIPRRALSNFIRSMQRQPGISADDVLVAVTTLSFDISGLELFLPLTVGARVVIATRDQASDGQELQDLLAATGATIMQATPATWRLLIDAGWTGTPKLSILCGGEALPAELAAQLLERCGALWNMYGPTETTIWSTLDRVTTAERITVGRPIANTQVYIVDSQLHPVPAGMRGEMCIAGDGVAHGYLNRPELTSEKFVPDPFSAVAGARMYRTGDLGRWLPDGRLDVLGRADQQVKLRGFRIELGEIEAVLERHDAIRQAVASVFDDGLGDRRLVAYIVHAPGVDATASELRRFLRRDLPDYMVPSLFIPLDTLPLTPNGKVDRKALPAPLGQQRRRSEVVAPRTEMEQRIAALWTDALGARDVSVFDNFFDIGGHSLLSLQVIARLEQQIGVRLNPTRFVMDTLEQIAAACEQMQNARRSA